LTNSHSAVQQLQLFSAFRQQCVKNILQEKEIVCSYDFPIERRTYIPPSMPNDAKSQQFAGMCA